MTAGDAHLFRKAIMPSFGPAAMRARFPRVQALAGRTLARWEHAATAGAPLRPQYDSLFFALNAAAAVFGAPEGFFDADKFLAAYDACVY